MATPRIFESEYRFCQLLWENEPIRSGALAALCREKLNWKPTTTYTVIRRLSKRGVVKNENCVVTSLVSRAEAESAEVGELLEVLPGLLGASGERVYGVLAQNNVEIRSTGGLPGQCCRV